jgi:Transposase
VASKHFQNKGRCEWWSIHMEAWQRSGLSQRRYCAQHRLTETTFLRWRKALMNEKALQTKAELLREEQRERRRKRHIRLSTDMRSKAVQAYWAMHVEAMTWAGMSAQAYAKAHHLSLHSLKRWRSLFEVGDVEIDWRTHLHPSARPLLGDSLKDITKALPADLRLTSATEEAPGREQRRRRKFSAEEKLAIVLESEQPGATVSGVARACGVAAGVLFRWRAELGFSRDKATEWASVVLDSGPSDRPSGPVLLQGLLQATSGMIAVESQDGRRVFAMAGADPDAVRRKGVEPGTNR